MRSKDPRLTIIGVFLAAATLMLGFPAPAHAQTVLVSNTGQSNAGQTSVNPSDHAQGFTTGQNTLGYSLTSIELGVGVASGSGTLTVTVRGDDGSGDPGGNTLYTLNNPANVAAGLRTFTAPAGASLSANTQYFVQMVFAPNGSASYPRWDNTTSSLQDSGSAIGWSIRNERHVRTPGSTGWGSTNFTVLQIRVNGQIRAPAAPMNLSAAPDDGQVTLSWANPANNTITKYQYRRKTDTGTYGSWTDIPNSGDTTTSYTVTSLTNGTEYTFGVRAVNAGGNGAASTVTATPAPVPAAPTKLEAEVGDRRIGLTWDNPVDSTIDEYEYSTDGGSFSVISGSDDATTSYTVTGLTNGTQYTFAVRAVNAVGNGAESSVTAKPLWPAPTGLVATPGQGRVTVEWNNGHDDIDDYYIYVYEDGVRRNTIFLPPGSGSTTTRTVYPLTNGTLYDFSVRALNGKESPTVTARPISMPAPENLTATEGDDRQTTLSWSDPDNDTIYKYQVSMDGGTTFTDISDSSKSTTTTTVTGLTNGTGYTLAVRGVNWWGYGAASTATATPLWPAPTNLVATPDSSRVFLEWDRNPGITDYRVDVSDGSSVSVSAGSGSKTIAAIDSLANGTAYTFTVLATQDSAQDSADSSWPAAVDATPMVVSPDAPTNLSATPSNSQATLSWDDPGNNTITKYQVSRDGGTSFTNISDSGASTTTTTVTGLTNGTLYTFAVRAENASGRGLAATTTATPVNDAPTASAKTVSTDEDTAYTFKGADFGFTSVKSGATLNHMKITALPGADKGTLSVGGTAITGVTTPRQVTKTGLDAGNLTYTPPANANGAAFATFAFKVNDGVADSDMAYTITINVNAVNDPLTGSDKTVSTDEDTAYIFKEADFAFSDVDAGATLGHVKITSLPGSNQGTLSVGDTPIASVSPPLQVTKDELGTLTYTPPTNAFGAAFATFNFKVSDGTDDSDKAYTITIDVNAVNDPPVAVTDNAETSEDIPVVIGVLENDSDVDPGTALRVVEVGFPTAPSKGTAAINPNNTTVTYTPNANVTGTDTFSYAVTDGFDTSNVEVAVEILGSGTNANLSNLTISQGTLMPDFSATTKSYAVRVEALTDSVQVTPTTADAQATVTVNGTPVDSGTASDDIELIKGETTTITVVVTAADGTPTQTTTIDVTRPLSDNANLSGLTTSSGTPTPLFAVGTTDYTVVVGNAVDRVTVTPTTEHADATVAVNGTLVTSGSASSEIDLIEGETTTIAVVVTAEDATTMRTYTIEVLRPRAGDETRPRVEIQTEASAPVGGAFEVTIRFSEGVLGFTLTDIGVSNGTASNFNRVSSRTYTVTITPEATGEVRVEVGSNVARDGAGNRNRAAEPLVIEADLTGPEVDIASDSTGAVSGAFEVTIAFSEPVTGFELEDIEVTNATASNFTEVSPQDYTATITPEETGEVTVRVRSNVAEDEAGNGNREAEPLVIEADLTGPEVDIASDSTGAVSGAFEVTIAFSEPVTGFELEDIEVTNATASNFTEVSPQDYTATITPEETGEVTVRVRSNVAEDEAGNGNREAEPLVIEADLTGPEVDIASDSTGAVSGAFEVTIAFSEPVTGFELEDIEVTNATASNFTEVSPQDYTATITPEESGEVRVEVGEDVAEDATGNGNEAAQTFTIEADLERPEVSIAGPTEPIPVGMAGFEVTITFSEPVEGFEREDIRISNAMMSDFTEVAASEYRATIEPAEAGRVVVVEVPEDVAEDRAGNGNRAAKPFEVEAKLAVSYEEEGYTATEGGEAATVTVKLSQGWDEELVIPIRVTRPETTEVADYTLDGLEEWDAQEGTGTLTFQAEETEQILRIAANHDGDGDDETLELGFGELPEIVMAGEPAVATVTLEDKGLVELKVSFGQAAYEIKEGEAADIKVTVSPAADRRVEVPLVVASRGGATDEDYGEVPASVVFEAGESQRTISVEVLMDDVNDPGEGIVLSFGELPQAVSAGEPASTEVHFEQRRMAKRFSQTLEGMAAVIARSTAVSAQTAIEGRFERHRQWSRLGPSVGALPTPQPGSDPSAAALSPRESERIGRAGAGDRGVDGSLVQRAWGAARTSAATGSGWNAENRETGTPGSWLRSLSLGSLGNLASFDPTHLVASPGSGMEPSGGVYRQDRLDASGVGAAPLGPGSGDFSGMRGQAFSLSGVSFEMSSGESEQATSWVPVLWGQGDVQHFDGDLRRLGMAYRGGLEAAHVGLDLYANDQMLAGLSFMRSWGDLDYTDDGIDGVLESRMTTVHPYLYWQPSDRLSVWGIGGLGGGQVAVEEPGRTHDFDADFRMLAGGVRAVLSRRGSHEWGLRGDGFTAQLETAALADIAQVSGEAHRGRLMLEWVHDRALSVGRSLSLQVEAGGRFDGGDAERGSGLETGFRLGYLDANRGLDVALHGRVLVVHASDYRDWGVGVQASWDPGEKQRGFRASVTSSWGRDGGGRTTLWDNADAVMRPAGMGPLGLGSQYRMESEVAYGGLQALGLAGLLTPYSRLRWDGQGRELALGTAWSLPTRSQQALPLMLELETTRRETQTGPAHLAVLARLSIPF